MSGVEDVEVSVFDPAMIEIGRGVGFSIEWGGVLSFSLSPSAD